MNRIIQLRVKEINNLVRVIKKDKESFRCLIILLSSLFKPSKVMKLLEISSSTFYDRISRYKIEKEASFIDKPKSGAPKKLTKEKEEELIETVNKFPVEEGSSYTKWNCRTLKIHLGLKVSIELIRLKLHENEQSWHKPRHMVSSPDPQRDKKLARIAEIESNLKENEVLLHEDESDFNLFSYLRNMWQPKGKQLRIQTPRKNKKVYAFGVKEKATGKFYYRVFQRKRAVEFIIFLKHVFSVYKGKKIYMVLDNYVVHDCSKVRAFLEQNKDKIELLFLPTYSPDDNKVIERVWGTVKEWINSNYMFADKSELTKYVHKGLRLYQLFKLKEKTS